MSKPRRVWATITQDCYVAFRDRCIKLGLGVPFVFRRLVEAWSKGEIDPALDETYNQGLNHGDDSSNG
jgi:hypothetical protein